MIQKLSKNINTKSYWDSVFSQGDNGAAIDDHKFSFFAQQIPDGVSLCDFGAGAGNFLAKVKELRPSCDLMGIDHSNEGVKHFSGIASGVVGDVTDTKLPSESFDVTTSFEVAEHLDKPEALIAELARVTRDLTFFTTPLSDHIPSQEHIWEFEIEDILSMFKKYYTDVYIFPFSSGRKMYYMGVEKYPIGNMDTIAVIAKKGGKIS